MKIKNFVLDTNVLLSDPNAIHKFEDNNIYLPIYVIEEIDKFKKDQSDLGRNARQICRYLDDYREKGKLKDGVKLQSGGILRVVLSDREINNINMANSELMDNLIMDCALQVKESSELETVFITKDTNLRIRADALDLKAENYEAANLPVKDIYDNHPEYLVDNSIINNIYSFGSFEVNKENIDSEFNPYINQYVLLKDFSETTSVLSKVTKVEEDRVEISRIHNHKKVWSIKAKNKEQQFAFDCLMNDDIKLVNLIGLAGSGKTILALACALQKTIEDKKYSKILVARPVFPLGRDIGFLPGDIEEKMNPWMQPIYDNLEFLLGITEKEKNAGRSYKELLDMGAIAIEPLTYIRGRSIPNQFMIIDECLSKNTYVWDNFGRIKKINKVREEDIVQTMCLNSKNNCKSSVSATLKRKASSYLKIEIENSLPIEATHNHPLYVIRNGEIKKLRCDEIKVNDFVISPKNAPHTVLNNTDIFTSYFYGTKSKQEGIPEYLWNAPLSAVKSFLSGLFDTHAKIHKTKKYFHIALRCGKIFLEEIHFLLKKLGVSSRIKDCRLLISGEFISEFKNKIGFSIRSKQKRLESLASNISMPSIPNTFEGLNLTRSNKKLISRGYFNKNKNSILSEIGEEKFNFLDKNCFFRVCKISQINEEIDVYDFKVPETGTFFANGILSSNCQNLSPHEVKTIITRAGEGTKIVLTGDPYQIDNPYLDIYSNGLTYVVNRFKNQKIAASVVLKRGERSELAELAADLL